VIVYRIGRTKHARDLTGEGARLYGGRWNRRLTACLYTSESRALAVLEYTVNVNIDDIPRALSITTLDIPVHSLRELAVKELPGDWMEAPAPTSTKEFGTALLQHAEYLVLKIPSAVIPAEYNYIINPAHKDSGKVAIVEVQDFVYDIRIKTT
jgi:RES domain-containing protein